jgi:hypothetical protein
VEQARASLRGDLRDVQPARFAAPADVVEHEHPLVVDLAVLLRRDAEALERAQELTLTVRHLGQPGAAHRPRSIGEPDSIPGSAQAADVKSPRSQSA